MKKELNTHKSKRILKIILVLLIVTILFLIIRSTYSKYVTNDVKDADFNISNWHILINNLDINNEEQIKEFSETLKINYVKNENVSENVIVPDSTGYFDITMESTGTEIPFKYEVSIDNTKSEFHDFKIISYSISNDIDLTSPDADKLIYDLKKDIDPSESSVTGIVEPVENITEKNINNIRFYVKWYDIDSNIENYNEVENKDISDNYGDVKISKEKSEFTLPIKLIVTQITHNDLNTNTTNTNTVIEL
jgi:hypothetical protein